MPKTLNTQLTPRQSELFDYYAEHEQKHDYSPGITKVAKHFKRSTTTIHQHLGYLEKKGYIVRDKGVKYSVRVVRSMRDLVLSPEKSIAEVVTIDKKEKAEREIEQKGNPSYEFFLGDSLKVLPQLTRKYNTIYLDP